VQEVGTLYEKREMVIIGGERRPHAYEGLKAALRLKGLIWISTREHESVDQSWPRCWRSISAPSL